jgi:hypothetical protein
VVGRADGGAACVGGAVSEILNREQRERIARLTATGPPDRPREIGKWAGAIGCVLLLALLIVGVAGMAWWVWRKALAG